MPDSATRSRMMAAIRSRDTVLEQIAHWVMADEGQLLGEFNGN